MPLFRAEPDQAPWVKARSTGTYWEALSLDWYRSSLGTLHHGLLSSRVFSTALFLTLHPALFFLPW